MGVFVFENYHRLVGGVLDLVAARKLKRVSLQLLDSSIAAALDPGKLFSEEFKLWWEQSDHWTDALRVKFVEDFGSEVAQLKGLKTTAMMAGWSKLANRDISLSSNIKFLEDPAVVDRLVGLYDDAHLRQVYQALLSAQTRQQSLTAFLKTFDDLGAAYYTRFADDVSLVKSWFRYYDEPVMRLEFNKLGKTKQLDFLDDFGKASDEILQSFRKNPVLIKHWDECHEFFVVYRKEIRFLDELHHFKVLDPNAFDHLAFFKNRPKSGQAMSKFHATGGHTEQIVLNGVNSHFITTNGIRILDPNFDHVIDVEITSDKMKDYINGIGTKVYSNGTFDGGHVLHKNILFELDPQPASFNLDQWVLNGKVYEFKAKHSQYKASWSANYIKHDMAFASMNKTLDTSPTIGLNPKIKPNNHGLNVEWIETTYKSKLLDGSKVEMRHSNYHRYNEHLPFYDHYTYFEIK